MRIINRFDLLNAKRGIKIINKKKIKSVLRTKGKAIGWGEGVGNGYHLVSRVSSG